MSSGEVFSSVARRHLGIVHAAGAEIEIGQLVVSSAELGSAFSASLYSSMAWFTSSVRPSEMASSSYTLASAR